MGLLLVVVLLWVEDATEPVSEDTLELPVAVVL